MARNNWAQHCSNDEDVVFQKGNWTLTEDGEKTWSLYYKDDCVDPVLDYNKFTVLKKGFILYRNTGTTNSYALYSETERSPIFVVSCKDIQLKIENDFITFYTPKNQISFDAITLMKVFLTEDNQIGLDF